MSAEVTILRLREAQRALAQRAANMSRGGRVPAQAFELEDMAKEAAGLLRRLTRGPEVGDRDLLTEAQVIIDAAKPAIEATHRPKGRPKGTPNKAKAG